MKEGRENERRKKERAYGIEVLFVAKSEEIAKQVCYGIEEEGIPYLLLATTLDCFEEAYCSSQKVGLSVAVGVDDQGEIKLFSRQLKKNTALLAVSKAGNSQARILGKNAARIIKKKPFILMEEA